MAKEKGVIRSSTISGTVRFLSAFILALFLLPSQGNAATWYWGSHPDKERLVIELDRPVGPSSVSRTGKRRLTVLLPAPEQVQKSAESPATGTASLLGNVTSSGNTISIDTRTDAFGYIVLPQQGNKLVVDFFSDPIGALWRPAGTAKKEPVPTAAATSAKPPVKPTAKSQSTAAQQPAPRTQAADTTPQQKTPSQVQTATRTVPAQANKPKAQQPVVQPPAATRTTPKVAEETLDDRPALQSAADNLIKAAQKFSGELAGQLSDQLNLAGSNSSSPMQMSGQNSGQNQLPATLQHESANSGADNSTVADAPKPFFSVPYTFRSRINTGGPEAWKPVPPKLTLPVEILPQAEIAQPRQAAQHSSNAVRGVIGPESTPYLDETGTAPAVKGTITDSAVPQATAEPVQQEPAQQMQQPEQAKPTVAAGSQPATGTVQDALRQKVQQSPDAAGHLADAGDSAAGAISGEERSAMPYPESPAPDLQAGNASAAAGSDIQVSPLELEKVSGTKEPKVEEEVVYVDEDGNPVEPPPTPAELLFRAKAAINNGEQKAALETLRELRRRNDLEPEQREEVLYLLSDVLYSIGKDDLLASYDEITSALTEAMNFNLKSARIPGALLRMGLVNLKIGNTREAEAYFNLLKREHPTDENIPLIYYYWGDHFFNNGQYQKAADQFQFVVQNHPDSRFVRESSVGLARALYRLGYYDQAYQIVDYIEKRWPRFYVEYPPFLNMMGDVAYRMKEYEKARVHYWTYYNIDPDGDEADLILARLGDIYLQQDKKDAAREVYEEAARKFPERDGGLIALMRLAEEGIYDTPSIGDMFTVFDRPFSLRPRDIYQKIINEHPQSELAPLAQVKLAMWYLWNRQYPEAMTTATEFATKFPGGELMPRAREVAMKAFNMLVADNIEQSNYARIMQVWDQYPIVRGQEGELTPESRIALGMSMEQRNEPAKALEVIDPFFRGLKVPKYSEMALKLALSIYLKHEDWDKIKDLARRIELWDLSPDAQRQLDYASALALENTGNSEQAVALWKRLNVDEDVPQSEEAYTLYFLARDAEQRRDLPEAYRQAQGALRNFTEMAEKNPEQADNAKIKDLLGMLMDITESSGRAQEALDWGRQYAEYVTPGDVDYPALRYRLARLYKKTADVEQWRTILTELRDKNPQSLYGRMAASELRSHELSQDAAQFSPTGRL
ncbi:tetratricopeptide repeat protein [Oleidesulfovibrio sp.]|uniref:tetratricopeptide repeat protein n=1 Tax=Oleidesulfovibrio sp. TaxID=2909707 RepID=UPI003A8C05C5